MSDYLDLIRELKNDGNPLSKRAAEAIADLLTEHQNDMAEITRLRRQIGGMLGE